MPRARKAPSPTANRTDLLTPRAEPVTTAPGQAYGKRTAQEQSQRILPLGPGPQTGTPPVAPPVGGGTPTPNPNPTGAGGGAPSPGGPAPADVPSLTAPSQRPQEPSTAGLRTPAAPGSLLELARSQQNEVGSTRQLLTYLASQPGASSVIKGMASLAGATIQP